MKVLVVGGGIAGLSTAIALRGAASVTVVERAPAWKPLGAGIMLAGNAIAGLDALGVDVRPRARSYARMHIAREDGAVLGVMDLARVEAELGQSYGIHRAELHEALLAACGHADVRLGTSVDAITEDADGVDVVLSDGTSPTTERPPASRYDLVVGADGLHSRVRELLGAAGEPVLQPIYSGYTCWRAVCADPGVPGVYEMWGRGRRFGFVPLAGGQLYVFLTANAPHGQPSADDADVLASFSSFGGPAVAVREALRGVRLLHHDLDELPSAAWGRPRTWLLGDAAHAMTPNFGQGGGQAIEDAVVAGRLLATMPVADAHRALITARDARVRKIQLGARRFGAVAQWENPVAVGLRNAAVRWTPAFANDAFLRDIVRPGLEDMQRVGPQVDAVAADVPV